MQRFALVKAVESYWKWFIHWIFLFRLQSAVPSIQLTEDPIMVGEVVYEQFVVREDSFVHNKDSFMIKTPLNSKNALKTPLDSLLYLSLSVVWFCYVLFCYYNLLHLCTNLPQYFLNLDSQLIIRPKSHSLGPQVKVYWILEYFIELFSIEI